MIDLKLDIYELQHRHWFKWLIIAAQLLICILIAAMLARSVDSMSTRPPLWFLALFGGLGLAIFAILTLHNMLLALTFLVLTSAVIDLPIATGTQSPVNLTILMVAGLTGLWIFRMFVRDKQISLVPSSINLPLIGFITVAVVSWLYGNLIFDWRITLPGNLLQVQIGQFAMFVLSATVVFLVANQPINQKTLQIWTVIIIAIGVAAIGADLMGIWPNPLPAAIGAMHMWPFVLLAAQLLFNPKLRELKWQVLGWAVIAMWAYWVIFGPFVIFTKGNWALAVLAIALLVGLRSIKLAVAAGLVGITLLFTTDLVGLITTGEAASSYRPLIWRDVLDATSVSPILGLGPANYMYYWQLLGNNSLTAQSIYADYGHLWNLDLIQPPSHNMYVDILAQTGIIGLLLFLLFAFFTLRLAWRLVQRLQPGFLQAHVYGVMTGFAAMLIGSFWFADWLIPFVYNIGIGGFRHSVYTWLLLGTLIAIDYSLKDTVDEQTG